MSQGSGGGPSEGNISGYLIRSTSTSWRNRSLLAVDAGTHLSGIIRILEEHQQSAPATPDSITSTNPTSTIKVSPFSGANLPFKTPKANAAYVTRELIATYLITHPHLDHLSGFVINTASFTHSGSPKRLAALPHAIKAIKTHIFNDVIWPNLSNEGSGVGLVSYQRLPEAMNPENSPEYTEVCDGLSVQAWPISHGHCMKQHSHIGSTAGLDPDVSPEERSPGGTPRICVYDSAVYFIRDEFTKKEVMMWGDVEPDSMSLSPRNKPVWEEAAKKVCKGILNVVFIECSFDCGHPDAALFGHLSPYHLMEELQCLADEVVKRKCQEETYRRERLKRKRFSVGYGNEDPEIESRRKENPNPPETLAKGCTNEPNSIRRFLNGDEVDPLDDSPRHVERLADGISHYNSDREEEQIPRPATAQALRGLQIVVTHVKDSLQDDMPDEANILASLRRLEEDRNLGVEFLLSEQGRSIFF